MSFGVKPIYSQPQIDLPILSAEKIEIRKIGFLMDFELHQKPLYNAVKYLVRKATHKQKIRKSFFRKLDLSEFLPDFNDFYMKKYLF